MTERTTAPAAAQVRGLVIERVFDAPRDLVWKAWTEPERMKRFWGPRDFTCPSAKIDFRVGGAWLSLMRSSEGQEIWSAGTYREIVPFERIVTTDAFADATRHSRHASKDHPLSLVRQPGRRGS